MQKQRATFLRLIVVSRCFRVRKTTRARGRETRHRALLSHHSKGKTLEKENFRKVCAASVLSATFKRVVVRAMRVTRTFPSRRRRSSSEHSRARKKNTNTNALFELFSDVNDKDERFAFGLLFAYVFFTLCSKGVFVWTKRKGKRRERDEQRVGGKRIFPVVVDVLFVVFEDDDHHHFTSFKSTKQKTTTKTKTISISIKSDSRRRRRRPVRVHALGRHSHRGRGDWFRVCSLLRVARIRRVRRAVGGERRAVDVRHVTHVVVGWELHSESF